MPSLTTLILDILMLQNKRPQQVAFCDGQTNHAQRRRDRQVTRRALQNPSMSLLTVLFNSICEKSLITITGLDHTYFVYLLQCFEQLYNQLTPYSSVWIRTMKSSGLCHLRDQDEDDPGL